MLRVQVLHDLFPHLRLDLAVDLGLLDLLERLAYWKGLKPRCSTARLLAARDADEAHPLRTEEEATEVVEYLWRLEREQSTST